MNGTGKQAAASSSHNHNKGRPVAMDIWVVIGNECEKIASSACVCICVCMCVCDVEDALEKYSKQSAEYTK